MLATTGVHRCGSQPVVEVKRDGCRAIIATDGERVRGRSRPGSSITGWFPELQDVAVDLDGRRVILDGEVIAPDRTGRPDFFRLQTRIGHAPRRGSVPTPIRFVAFDVLAVDGRSHVDRPWQARRETLEEIGQHVGSTWTVAPCFDDVDAAVTATRMHGLEGVVVKDRTAPYLPGQRSRAWVKIKHTRTSRLIVGGIATTSRCPAALLVGSVSDDGSLLYRGCVEAAMARARRSTLAEVLERAATDRPPFVDPPRFSSVTWVEPRLVVEVRHLGYTGTGRLREAMLLGPVDLVDPEALPTDLVG